MRTIGLIAAMKIEANKFLSDKKYDLVEKGNRLFYVGQHAENNYVLSLSNSGPVNASATTESLIIQFKPDCIVNFGSAGSHTHKILPGDVVIGRRYTVNYNVLDEVQGIIQKKQSSLIRHYKLDKEERILFLEADDVLLEKADRVGKSIESELEPLYEKDNWFESIKYRKPKIFITNIGSEDNWTIDANTIQLKKEKFGHEVEDKESAYIAQICHIHDMPFISIRSISDNELVKRTASVTEVHKLIEDSSDNVALFVNEFLRVI